MAFVDAVAELVDADEALDAAAVWEDAAEEALPAAAFWEASEAAALEEAEFCEESAAAAEAALSAAFVVAVDA